MDVDIDDSREVTVEEDIDPEIEYQNPEPMVVDFQLIEDFESTSIDESSLKSSISNIQEEPEPGQDLREPMVHCNMVVQNYEPSTSQQLSTSASSQPEEASKMQGPSEPKKVKFNENKGKYSERNPPKKSKE